MKRTALIILVLITSIGVNELYAQPYENAVGIKAGYSTGVVFKHFMNRDFAIEGQALYNLHGFQFTALYEYQFTPYSRKQLYYFFGAGGHFGNWDSETVIGIALLAGTEYTFRAAPVIIGLEWKPAINVYGSYDLLLPDIALTLKVRIN